MAKGNIVSTLKKLFPEINFNIRTRVNEDVKYAFDSSSAGYPTMEPYEHLYFVLRSLEKDLRRASKKLSTARKQYKLGDIGIEEVQDHEFYVYELELQIEDVSNRLDWY
jgi:hypothetical protein